MDELAHEQADLAEHGTGRTAGQREWWKEAVVYQIYPRSFNDSDGDGVGDLPGIVEKVDHLDDLGVDVVWLNPVFDSPMVDYGYDVRNFREIHDEYGTFEDWAALRDALHEREIALIMDVAVNHTSDRHRWFRRSRRGEAPYDDFYHWVEGPPDSPPNDWMSFFGGSAWSYDDEREAWYLSLFDDTQPDLNWRNPAVRERMYGHLRWWLERGCDGFRLDVVNLISKREGYPAGEASGRLPGSEHYLSGPNVHEYVREMADRVFEPFDALSVGETVNVTPEEARRFTVEDGLSMVFPFEHVNLDRGDSGPWDFAEWDLPAFKRVTERWQSAVGDGWIGTYLGNHDQPRMVSRYGDDGEYRLESATMLATYLLTLRGTPYVYQGDEIGMTNAPWQRREQFRDPATKRKLAVAEETGRIEGFQQVRDAVAFWSRDNARTPMQWTAGANAGFTDGEPWIGVNPNHAEINVQRERQEEGSVLAHYRRLIDLRERHPALVYGRFDLLAEDDPDVLAYRRTLDGEPGALLVVLNFFDGEPTFRHPAVVDDDDDADLLLCNYERPGEPSQDAVDLRPYEARVYRLR